MDNGPTSLKPWVGMDFSSLKLIYPEYFVTMTGTTLTAATLNFMKQVLWGSAHPHPAEGTQALRP